MTLPRQGELCQICRVQTDCKRGRVCVWVQMQEGPADLLLEGVEGVVHLSCRDVAVGGTVGSRSLCQRGHGAEGWQVGAGDGGYGTQSSADLGGEGHLEGSQLLGGHQGELVGSRPGCQPLPPPPIHQPCSRNRCSPTNKGQDAFL